MDVLRIVGGHRLKGEIEIDPAKNAVLPIMAAALLTDEPVRIIDCPKLKDVENMVAIMETLGCRCDMDGDDLIVDSSMADGWEMPGELSKSLRSSIFMMGSILGRFGKATVTYPGGCEIGQRPIDLHLKGLKALGVKLRESHGMIYCDGSAMRGGEVLLDFPSVGATENVMMAAVLSPGRTVIHNAAREPEIRDLEQFINSMGGKVSGGGTNTVYIEGVKRLHGTEYRPLPDRIVTGTLLCAAAMTGGDIRVSRVVPDDLGAVLNKLTEAGCELDVGKDTIRLKAERPLNAIEVYTMPFPGFPTDMQAQMMALACVARGASVVVENVFESRFAHASELRCMGADIRINNRTAVIQGGKLMGAQVKARDLRGGAALVLAGLAADGITEVGNAALIDRGYASLERMLNQLGANIVRV